MFKLISRKIITPNVQILALPVAVIAVSIIFILYALQNGYSTIRTQLTNLTTNKDTERLLRDKADLLRKMPPGILDSSNAVVVGLPEKNPGIFMISQMKTLATPDQMILQKVDLRDESKFVDTVSKMQFTGEFLAVDYPSLINFLNGLYGVAPISTLESLETELVAGQIKGELKASVYWSPLPKELPPLTEALKELTPEEQSLLGSLSSLKLPDFSVITPGSPSERENPFN